ncbi:MAG TPA: hypothetical protein VK604_18455 [Bryobacteraceae bacterium]|nr:hypothetical protein [Bryobacteraceae bacterium]
MAASSGAWLEVLLIEELNYAPAVWQRVKYFTGSELLEPEISDICARAQLLAFCRSFLRHFKS